VILLKCYDSKEDGRARFSAHSAFDDPTTRPDAAPRESIEIRALVFWPDQDSELSGGWFEKGDRRIRQAKAIAQ
jgi:hypothetical protein